MKLLIALCGLCLASTQRTDACSEPLNWERLPTKDVLEHQDLVVLGKFSNEFQTEEDVNGYPRYVIRLQADVDCVLLNRNNVNIGAQINISEFRVSGFNDVPLCTDYYCCTRLNSQAIISLAANENFPGEFEFREYNMQGHTYYTDHTDLKKGEWKAWFVDSARPVAEGTCNPEIKHFGIEEGSHAPNGCYSLVVTALACVLSLIFSV